MTFQEFKNQYQKASVEQFSCDIVGDLRVSVCVQTYQHKEYIRDCLESILVQKTSFNFEILIGEDDSSDGTREICLEYAKRYPNKIRLILHDRKNNIKILSLIHI